MPEKYYFDTYIWRDFYESRTGLKGKPLGKYAANLFLKIIKRKDTLFYSDLKARKIAEERDLSIPDAFHAILARNNKAILISQDKHLQELKDIVEVKKPEEIT